MKKNFVFGMLFGIVLAVVVFVAVVGIAAAINGFTLREQLGVWFAWIK